MTGAASDPIRHDVPAADAVRLPFAAPEPGELVEVAPGILWSRLPLPYQPGHVNTYLIDEGDGWCVVDAGLCNDETMAVWNRIVANLPHHRAIKNVLVTHWHSDHSGAAGWLCEHFQASLLMSEAEYSKCLLMEFLPRPVAGEIERRFLLSHGLPTDAAEEWVAHGHDYLYMSAHMPHTYRRLVQGNRLRLGGHDMRIRTAPGHSPEEVMLQWEHGGVYLCADQLGPKIAPNVAVQANDPLGDPLALYLRSLEHIATDRPEDALMLPGHEAPFRGFSTRLGELRAYYERRCAVVEDACRASSKTGYELVGHLFRKPPGPVWIGFVMAEAITYANYLVGSGRLIRQEEDRVIRFRAR